MERKPLLKIFLPFTVDLKFVLRGMIVNIYNIKQPNDLNTLIITTYRRLLDCSSTHSQYPWNLFVPVEGFKGLNSKGCRSTSYCLSGWVSHNLSSAISPINSELPSNCCNPSPSWYLSLPVCIRCPVEFCYLWWSHCPSPVASISHK